MKASPKYLHSCGEENAALFMEWIKNRGGVAIWKSINLSNASGSWSTPANEKDGTPKSKPTWQAGNVPTIITDASRVSVSEDVLYKAFPVALRRGHGFSIKISDGSQRKLDKYMRECELQHDTAFYKKDVLPDANASLGVYYSGRLTPLDVYMENTANKETAKEWPFPTQQRPTA